MNYKEIMTRFKNELENNIAQETSPLHFNFIMRNYGKEHFQDEDLVELRGYFKGLKVAKEMLERHIAIQEEIEEGEEE